jgi:hypothetical protein
MYLYCVLLNVNERVSIDDMNVIDEDETSHSRHSRKSPDPAIKTSAAKSYGPRESDLAMHNPDANR